ncbi:general substrate transporter [Coniophora puteana RWD-64-598 SS2]|uniref:General substrate transporter n=1 Tax=Coniophora puteana (strain RWD-64-598) TaxID=741705 RepID=A0A5M3MVA1_CONPW|nr:general substrate transporter [Coniophora puteana RWD-64-598 SS2]EIW82521.1 general substrate transporter [Coniophora puteana RWD-64-598 SS2]
MSSILGRNQYTARYPRWMVGKPLLYMTSALASLGDAMFGYGQGIIAAVQVQPSFIKCMFGKDVTLEQIQAGDTGVDPWTQAIMVSCLNLTALLSSFAAAYICDNLGRRMSVRVGAILYLIAAFIQIFAPNLAALIVGRSIQGVGVGILSMTVPILQCEIAPGHARGLFVSIEYICLNLGYAVSAWVGYAFFFAMPSEISWRGPYIVQAALALVLVVWTFFLPETPRWLISNGFKEEGLATLADLHSAGDITDPDVLHTYNEIVNTLELEAHMGQASWGQLFTQYTRRTIVGITCQMFAQMNGINAILYFLPENLNRAGFSISKSLLYAGICSLVYCSGTIPAMFLIDKWGRRVFLLVGSVALAASLSIVGGLQFYSDALPEGFNRIPAADGLFFGVCLYLFFFGATWGPGPWLLGAEIFPLRARAKGMSLSTGTNWLFNFIIAFITPPLFAILDAGYYFLLVGFCLISLVFVYFVYPETAHRTLEELGEVFRDSVIDEEKDIFQIVNVEVATIREEPLAIKSEQDISLTSSDTTLQISNQPKSDTSTPQHTEE